MTGWAKHGIRTVVSVAMVIVIGGVAGCTAKSSPPASSRSTSTALRPAALSPGTINLNCSATVGTASSLARSFSSPFQAVGVDTSTLQANPTDGNDPHRLFAKTWLYVHVGQESTLTVPVGLSIAWGNHTTEWTTSLHIPACPEPPGTTTQWLAFPGGFSLDTAACVPLKVRTANETATIHVSVGTRCHLGKATS
jgi:hypothetical protein